MNKSVAPPKAVHPTTAMFFHGKNAMADGDYTTAVDCFEKLMKMLKAEPEKYADDIETCEFLLENCRNAIGNLNETKSSN